jgi:hypothetical protein
MLFFFNGSGPPRERPPDLRPGFFRVIFKIFPRPIVGSLKLQQLGLGLMTLVL